MPNFKSADEILDFAIKNEEEAADLYDKLSKEMKYSETRKFFKELRDEELQHKAKILHMKKTKQLEQAEGKITDLKISDYMLDIKLDPSFDYQGALIYAMKAEKAEFKLYTDLARRVDNEQLKNTLLILAQEEAKHKLRLELEYDDNILKEG